MWQSTQLARLASLVISVEGSHASAFEVRERSAGTCRACGGAGDGRRWHDAPRPQSNTLRRASYVCARRYCAGPGSSESLTSERVARVTSLSLRAFVPVFL